MIFIKFLKVILTITFLSETTIFSIFKVRPRYLFEDFLTHHSHIFMGLDLKVQSTIYHSKDRMMKAT